MVRRRVLLFSFALLGVFVSLAAAALFDHSSYDAILNHYVDEEGLVDYTSIRENSLSALESYFERIGEADLAGWSYSERLAFWINAYNARVIYLVAQKPEMKKISEDFDLFNHSFKTAGRKLTLNDIEHRILRGTLNPDTKEGPIPGYTLEKRDPRIHFALVCGAVDCPRLRNFAYTAENVEETLDANAKRFANSSRYIEMKEGRLRLSSILKWYGKDFAPLGGVPQYLSSLLNPDKRDDAEFVQKFLLKDFKNAIYTYDWTVNAQTPPAAP